MQSDETHLRGVYVISVAAELAGVHPQTLRVYERKGLLSPMRTIGNDRRYSDFDIAMLRRIQELTSEGVGLPGVQRILALEAQVQAMQQRVHELETQLAEAQREIQAAAERVHREYRRDLVPVRTSMMLVRRDTNHGGS
jgi:MerR family transcriptional regulator/heat shock protein HspR